jgi:hypothetical protein
MQIRILLMIADLKLTSTRAMDIFHLRIMKDQLVEKLWNLALMIIAFLRLHNYSIRLIMQRILKIDHSFIKMFGTIKRNSFSLNIKMDLFILLAKMKD